MSASSDKIEEIEFEIVRGDGWGPLSLTIYDDGADPDDDSDDTPIDITGDSFHCEFREHSEDGDLLLRVSTDDTGVTIMDGPNGVVQIDEVDTDTWEAGVVYADVERVVAGSKRTIVKLKLTLIQDVTE